MKYIVEEKVATIRHYHVEAASAKEAEEMARKVSSLTAVQKRTAWDEAEYIAIGVVGQDDTEEFRMPFTQGG